MTTPADSGRLALVTGASSGIGLDLAKLLATDGNQLVLVARNEGALKTLADELRDKHHVAVHVIVQDLSDSAGPAALVAELAARNLEVHTLINNAGFGSHGLFADADVAQQMAMIQVNVAALTHLTRLLLPQMVDRGSGKILNVASTAASQPGPLMAVYYATKAYVLSFSEAIAVELHGTGVTVTALCPGPTMTDFHKRAHIENTRLFAANTMSSRDVAQVGYDAMLAGKRVAIAGWRNKLLMTIVKFSPRGIVLRVAKRLNAARPSAKTSS